MRNSRARSGSLNDNRMIRAELSQVEQQLIRVTAERDVLERVVTTALIAGAESAAATAAGSPPRGSRRRV